MLGGPEASSVLDAIQDAIQGCTQGTELGQVAVLDV